MNMVFHQADTRGHADHGWLNAWHSFSFAGYHDSARVHFGALRVLNDDTVAAGMGFGKHPHDNMEIVTIPLEGALEHQDSMGNTAVIRKGDVQAMSAGTGILHSEKNPSHQEAVRLLQIWVFPEKKNVQPRYDQKTFRENGRHNSWQNIVAPMGSNSGAVEIHQQAWFHLARLDEGENLAYKFQAAGNGVYAFLIDGEVEIGGQTFTRRDAAAITGTHEVYIKSKAPSELLVIEVPMQW